MIDFSAITIEQEISLINIDLNESTNVLEFTHEYEISLPEIVLESPVEVEIIEETKIEDEEEEDL